MFGIYDILTSDHIPGLQKYDMCMTEQVPGPQGVKIVGRHISSAPNDYNKCPLYVMQVKCTSDEYLDTLKTVSPSPDSRVSAQTRVSGSGCLTVSERLLESNSEQ